MKKRGIFTFLGKRADTNKIYFILIEIVIALAVYWALQSYVDSVAKDTLFEKYYLSNDLSLLAETVYIGQGDLSYYYSNDLVQLNRFSFDFGQQKAGIVETEGNLPVAQPYGEDTKIPYSGQRIEIREKIEFTKTKDRLEIK